MAKHWISKVTILAILTVVIAHSVPVSAQSDWHKWNDQMEQQRRQQRQLEEQKRREEQARQERENLRRQEQQRQAEIRRQQEQQWHRNNWDAGNKKRP